MNEEIDFILDAAKESMDGAMAHLEKAFIKIRAGKASPAMLSSVMVEYYGSQTPLSQVANINTPDASTTTIQPYDKGSLASIEKAISLSDVGLTPNNDGSAVRLNIPPLTSDRRQELVKQIGKLAEEGKVSVRNIRRDAIDSVRKQEKSSDISKDESRDSQDKIQKLTDKYTAKIDDLLAAKEKDITTL